MLKITKWRIKSFLKNYWFNIVMWLATSNQRALFQNTIVMLLWNLFMTLAPENIFGYRVAAITPWFRLHLLSCGPGFDSQALHLCFFNLWLICDVKRTKINEKEAGIGPYLKKYLWIIGSVWSLLLFWQNKTNFKPSSAKTKIAAFNIMIYFDLEWFAKRFDSFFIELCQ